MGTGCAQGAKVTGCVKLGPIERLPPPLRSPPQVSPLILTELLHGLEPSPKLILGLNVEFICSHLEQLDFIQDSEFLEWEK